jgi:putative phosphoesterase
MKPLEESTMKWFIASDLHGSAYYTRQLFKAYEAESADRILLLGDLLYHGPRNDLPRDYAPKEVIEILNAHKDSMLCVRGNCEAEVDQMVLKFPVLADYALLSVGSKLIFATHGHHFHNGNLPAIRPGDVLLHGHTHVPACEEYPTHIYINPGSVSIPKEGSHHGYMILQEEADGATFLWKDLDGTVLKTYRI